MKTLVDIIYRFLAASIRRQLILGIVVVHAVLMSIFVYDLVERQRDFLHSQSLAQAQSLALSLATNSSSWVLSNDIIGLEEMLESQKDFPSLRYAMVLNPEGKILGHTEKDKVGLYLHDEISVRLLNANSGQIVLLNNDSYVDIASPIVNNGQFIGWARVNLSQKFIADNLMVVTRDGLLYTLLAIIVGALFAFLMARGITKALQNLVNVAEEVKEGDINVRAAVSRHDEVGKLAEDINIMLDTISNSRRDLQAIMDNSPNIVYVKDPGGRFIFVNRQFETSLRSEKKNMLGKTFYDFFPENIADELQSTDEGVLQKGEFVKTDVVVPVGEVLRNYHSAKFPLYDENNTIYGVCVFTTDTTDSVKMEAEKTSLENQLFHAQKMQAIGQLTGGIAHDFNNLLAVILGYTELSQIKYSQEEGDLKNYLQAIESAGIRGRELVEQMMIYSRKDHIETSSIRIEPVLEDTINMLKATFPASIDIQTSISPSMPSVQSHSGLLSQVLMNLCINAKDSMGTEGCLSISLFVDNVCDQECNSCHENFVGEFAVIEISDTGAGIDPDVVNHVFEPFFTSKKIGEGTGMGLSVVDGIVHKSGGHICVTSIKEEGTCFRVFLPVSKESEKVEGAQSESRTNLGDIQYDFSDLTIMIVDDELAVANYLKESLQMHHANVELFTSSRLALEHFEKEGDNIDIVITDQTMPELSGTELSEQLLACRNDLKIVLCTGHSDSVTEESALALGIKSFLHKPFDVQKLNMTINNLK